MKKKILVNGHFLLMPFTGIGVYTRQILEQWSSQSEYDIHVIVYGSQKMFRAFHAIPHIHIHRKYKPKFVPMRIFLLWIEYVVVPNVIKKIQPDVYWSPFAHILPKKSTSLPVLMTLHDTFQLEHPEYTKKITRKWYNKKVMQTLANIHICTVSNDSAQHIQRFLQREELPEVVYNGVDHLVHVRPASVRILHDLDIQKPYIFYHGGYDVRKNIPFLLEVFLEIRKHMDIQLVLGGSPLFHSSLYAHVVGHEDIRKTGFVTENELVTLYKESACFLHLSLQEGFNIPVGEALSLDVPVICSDIPVHRELWKDAVTYVSTHDIFLAAEQVMHILKRNEMPHEELDETTWQGYTWEQTAEKLLDTLKKLSHTGL